MMEENPVLKDVELIFFSRKTTSPETQYCLMGSSHAFFQLQQMLEKQKKKAEAFWTSSYQIFPLAIDQVKNISLPPKSQEIHFRFFESIHFKFQYNESQFLLQEDQNELQVIFGSEQFETAIECCKDRAMDQERGQIFMGLGEYGEPEIWSPPWKDWNLLL